MKGVQDYVLQVRLSHRQQYLLHGSQDLERLLLIQNVHVYHFIIDLGGNNDQVILEVVLVQLKPFGSKLDDVGLIRVQVVQLLINKIEVCSSLCIVLQDDLATLLDILIIQKWDDDRILQVVPVGVLYAFVR